MSATISAVLPTLAAELQASVASLQVKEAMFSGKVTDAQSAYQNADESGAQSVGQLTQMLGQVGQMAQQSGQAGGGGGGQGVFGQLMERTMTAGQGTAPPDQPGQRQQGGKPRDEERARLEDQQREHEAQRADRAPVAAPERSDAQDGLGRRT